MKSCFSVFLLVCLSMTQVSGAILVHLRNGTEFEAKAQQASGDVLQFAVGGGTIELPATEVDRTETVADNQPQSSFSPIADPVTAAEMLKAASHASALPLKFLQTVANAESGLQTEAVSPKGAVGLMQLMPATAAQLGVHEGIPAENALGGARYLRELLLRYKGDARLALAAYNAGPAAVERYRGVPPYPETIAYVNKILKAYSRLQRQSAVK